MNLKHTLHGHGKHETVERYMILGLLAGVLVAGIGIASTILGTKGLTSAVTLVGSFITFVFTVVLVFYWTFRGDK